jgi:hypothetical protein
MDLFCACRPPARIGGDCRFRFGVPVSSGASRGLTASQLAEALLFLAHRSAKPRSYFYSPGPLEPSEAKKLDDLLRKQGFRRFQETLPVDMAFLHVELIERRQVSPRSFKLLIHLIDHRRLSDVASERNANLYFKRTKSGWLLQRRATKYQPGE